MGLDKATKRIGRRISQRRHATAAKTLGFLHCDCDAHQRLLAASTPATQPGLLAADVGDVGFIHLNRPGQPVPARTHQHRTHPMQHGPGGLVGTDLHRPLHAQRRYVGNTGVFLDPSLDAPELGPDEFIYLDQGFRELWYSHYIIMAGRYDMSVNGSVIVRYQRGDLTTPYRLHRMSDADGVRVALGCAAMSLPWHASGDLGTLETPMWGTHADGGGFVGPMGFRRGTPMLGANATYTDGHTAWAGAGDLRPRAMRDDAGVNSDVVCFW